MRIIFIINTVLLIVFTISLSYFLILKYDINKKVKQGFNKIYNTMNNYKTDSYLKKHTYNITQKMTYPEKVELFLIDKSNIKHYVKFFNFNTLVICMLLIFGFFFIPVYRVLYSIISASFICFIFSFLPVFILDLMGRSNSDKIRKKLSQFISILSRWCEVKEDIFYAFEKSLDSGIGEPLRTYISELIIQIKHGVDPIEALDILELKVRNPQFKIFIINIKQNVKARGNIINLLSNLEDQFYAIDEEYTRLKISTLLDRVVIYITMVMVILVGYYFLQTNSDVRHFYLGTFAGKIIMSVFCGMFALGTYFAYRITKFDY